MTARYPALYRVIQLIALAAIVLSLSVPALVTHAELPIALALILLIGIPHGATDHLIFQHLRQAFLGGTRLTQFYLNYLLLMLGYSLLWWASPWAALLLFLGLSVYHFGQSNWNYAAFSSQGEALFTYTIWGALAVFAPLLFHYEEASLIIAGITGGPPPPLTTGWRWTIFGTLLLTNLWWTVYLAFQFRIRPSQLREEWANLFLLSATFFCLPLLLGFTFYFVFWHSLSSILDQIRFFQQHIRTYDWKNYFLQTLPFSLLAIGGLGGMYWLNGRAGLELNIGMLFIFISVITLPHMLLIDRLYDELASEEQVLKSEENSLAYQPEANNYPKFKNF